MPPRWTPPLALALALYALPSPAADPPPTPDARAAVRPIGPVVPPDLLGALQEGKTDDAVASLDKLASDAARPAEDRQFWLLLKAGALRRSGKLDEARATLDAAVGLRVDGRWSAKIRGERVAVELAAKRFPEAERIARRAAENSLDDSRKDRLAQIERGFALGLLHPDSPTQAPDPAAAHALLESARGLAKSKFLRAKLLREMAEASALAGNHAAVVAEANQYLTENPDGADRPQARYDLGVAQLALGQTEPARRTFSDLARDLANGKKANTPRNVQDFAADVARDLADGGKANAPLRARALAQVAITYGIPNPGNDTHLALGIAALRAAIEADPNSAVAVKARHEIARSYENLGKTQEAHDALLAFLAAKGFEPADDAARKEWVERSTAAAFEVGQVLMAQAKFSEAIAAFEGYLARYPNGPQSADAQRAILDAKLRIAQESARRAKFADARRAWEEFATKNPLDPRVPGVLFLVGQSFAQEKKYDDAIAAWQTLANRFPSTPQAASAQFAIASTYEIEKGDPATAIDKFKAVGGEPLKAQAAARIAVMERNELEVTTERVFRSNETAKLKVRTRNLETLTFSAYRLDPEDYFRKKLALEGVETLDVGLVAPDSEWKAPVPGYAKFKPVESTYELKVKLPGVYVVKVTDEKTLRATTLVVGSDVEAILKASKDQVLVFVQDMLTGKGRPNARVVLATEEAILLEGTTGPDGVLLRKWAKPLEDVEAVTSLILDGPHAAGSLVGVSTTAAQGLSPRAYIDTDRPAYRPGQTVELRGVVREVDEGRYSARAGADYKLEVIDSRGRPFLAKSIKLSEFGTFAQGVPLDSAAPIGKYKVRVYRPGGSDFSGEFAVEAYSLRKIDLTFDLPRLVYYRGETVKGSVVAKYQYGTPLAGHPIALALPDGRTIEGKTDATGSFAFELPTGAFAEEQALALRAALPRDEVAASASVRLATRAFSIAPKTAREVYLDGETFPLELATTDAQGKPVGEALNVAILKRVEEAGRTAEREVRRLEAKTDAKTGRASVPISVSDEDGGAFVLRASGTDRFGNAVVADRVVTISGKNDETKIRILSDRTAFKVGEEAAVRLVNRGKGGPALLTWEADRVLSYRVVPLNEGETPLTWTVDDGQFPNVSIAAARMDGSRFDQARLDATIERSLSVTIEPARPQVGPGEEVEVTVRTDDQNGKPVSAEVSLALVDEALLRLFQESRPEIGAFFHDQSRTGAFETSATNTFDYHAGVGPVSRALVDEQERQVAEGKDAEARQKVGVYQKLATGGGRPRRRANSIEYAGMTLPSQGQNNSYLTYSFAARSVKSLYVADAWYIPASDPNLGLPFTQGSANVIDFRSGWNQQAATSGEGDRKTGARMGGGNRFGKDDYAEIRNGAAKAEEQPSDAPSDVEGKPGAVPLIVGRTRDQKGLDEDFDANDQSPKAGRKSSFAIPGFTNPRAAGLENANAPAEKQQMIARIQVAPRPREAFTETAYWNPHIVTDKDGTARVKVRAPMALSRYRFAAKGVTGSDTLAGQATAPLDVRKPFFVEMTVPSAFTQGDKPRFAARVHHPNAVGKLELRLAVYSGERETVIPRAVDASKEGTTEVTFDPVAIDGESLRIELTARLGDLSDSIVQESAVRPWGVEAIASSSGASRDDTTAIVGLPAGRTYVEPDMTIVVSPSVRGLLIERALEPAASLPTWRCGTPAPSTTSDRASDLRGAASVLMYLRSTRAAGGPEAERLIARVRGLVSELVTQQNEDGGWSWVATNADAKTASDRLATADVVLALSEAEPLGLIPDPKALERAETYLAAEFAKAESGDTDVRAALLDAMAARHRAGFEAANALHRIRLKLSNAALAHLALTFGSLGRPELAGEVLDVLAARSRTGEDQASSWTGSDRSTSSTSAVEATALATLAFARVRPADAKTNGAEWLLAHREGAGWSPYRAQGTVLAALSAVFGRAEAAEDRYRLAITVNDEPVKTLEVAGTSANAAIRVPRRFVKAGGENRVRFDIEGRGRYAYSVTLSGFTRDFAPDQSTKGKAFAIDRRVVTPAPPEFEGRAIPSGFTVAPGSKTFENAATGVPAGGRVRVSIASRRFSPEDGSTPRNEPLAIEEHLPVGASLVEGSLASNATMHTLQDGVLTLYYAADVPNPHVAYDLYGVLPGAYRVLPARISSVYEPGRYYLGPVGGLDVLEPGAKPADPYTPTPDELYARGKSLFDAGRLDDAARDLEALWGGYSLRDDVAKDSARMLLQVFLRHYDARKVVAYFEVLKEKAPELVIPFDDVKVIGRAYGDLGEHERAVLVWRGASDASYLEDATVGEVLRQKGKRLESAAFLLDLWRDSTDSPAIRADLFGLAQVLATTASTATTDANTRSELAAAGSTRSDLLDQATRLTAAYLALAPDDPTADEASLALVGFRMDLKDYESVVALARRFAAIYPKSTYLDSFQYAEALARFHLGQHDRAITVAETIADATYKDASGVDQPSPNKWQALYILGQIHDARREPAKAVSYYERVADRFTDAADAVKSLTRKELSLPEVSGMPKVHAAKVDGDNARGEPIRADDLCPVPGQAPAQAAPAAEKPGVLLTYRNLAEVEVKVYPVDLMRLYLEHGDLDDVAGVDLAGITPRHRETIRLGDGKDYAVKTRRIELPLGDEGAYLVIARGESLYASGIVLVAPLALEILEDEEAGRVRVTVRDPKTNAPVPGAQVRIKGSETAEFPSGETDLRGVFAAQGLFGTVTAVARLGPGRYAFYRGPEAASTRGLSEMEKTMPPPAKAAPSLEDNIRNLNDANRARQTERLEQRHQQGKPGGASAGGFR